MDTTHSLKVKDLYGQTPRVYKVTTALGSSFDMVYVPTMHIECEDKSDEQGDILLQGYSVLAGKNINLSGIGFKPEEGYYLTVIPFPEEEGFDTDDYTELITNIKEVTND